MPAYIEQRIILRCLPHEVGELVGVFPERFLVLEKGLRCGVAFGCFYRGGVQGCFSAFGRGDGDVDAGFFEDVVWMREFGEVPVYFGVVELALHNVMNEVT